MDDMIQGVVVGGISLGLFLFFIAICYIYLA